MDIVGYFNEYGSSTALILAFVSIIFATLLVVFWKTLVERVKNGKKGLYLFLFCSWFGCLMFGAMITQLCAPPIKQVYKGYWYNPSTGTKLRDEYETTGGVDMAHMLLFVFSWAIIGFAFGYGISILISKEKSIKSKIITLIAFIFFAVMVYFSPFIRSLFLP